MYIIIKTSTDSLKVAKKISQIILNKKLSPCINIIENTKSSFIWKNKTTNTIEHIVEVKTINIYKDKIVDIIKKNHNYDVPEIIQLNIHILNNDYKEWFDENITK